MSPAWISGGNSKTKTSEEEQGKRTFSSPRGLALLYFHTIAIALSGSLSSPA